MTVADTNPTKREQFPFQRSIKRGAIVGFVVGIAIGYCEFWFLDGWLGGVTGGFIAAVVEFLRTPNWDWRRHSQEEWLMTVIAGTAILWGAASLVFPIAGAKHNIRELKSLAPAGIREIRIRPSLQSTTNVISDTADVRQAFTDAVQDIRLNHPGKGKGRIERRYIDIVLQTGRVVELELIHDSGYPNVVQGTFIETPGNALIHRGGFRSRQLSQWFRTYALGFVEPSGNPHADTRLPAESMSDD